MEKHFVTFYSPGTIVSETREEEISSWDVNKAVEMARHVVERHGAKPYGFRFSTRFRSGGDLDSRAPKHSGMYYLGGTIRNAAEILAGTDPEEEILRTNVRINKFERIITNDNSWRFTTVFNDDDTLLEVKL